MQNENNMALCLKNTDKSPFLPNDIEFDYSMFEKEGFNLDYELLRKFQDIIKKLNLSYDSLKMLLEIALEMSLKQKSIYEKDEITKHKENIAKYTEMFGSDNDLPDLNTPQINNYMRIANNAYMRFASSKLKELLDETGLNYHPELIKMFHKIGELIKEDTFQKSNIPSLKELTPAQILYGPRD